MVRVKVWRMGKYLLAEERIKKWCAYTVEYYSAVDPRYWWLEFSRPRYWSR